jgi:hypothetical protein
MDGQIQTSGINSNNGRLNRALPGAANLAMDNPTITIQIEYWNTKPSHE